MRRALVLCTLTACTGTIGEPGARPPPPEPVIDPLPIDCTAPAPGPRLLRRLSRGEYDRTVSDLLGVTSTHGAGFAADTVAGGYDNDAAALIVSPLLADQLRLAAEDLAARADLAALVPCAAAERCVETFVRAFGERAFRRAITAADVDRYLRVYRVAAEDEGFEGGVRWVLAAMLQSPSFLYRTELGAWDGATYTLDAYERATALAYFLTGTTPDDALLALARSGELLDPAVAAGEAERLFRSPRGRAQLVRFAESWLEVDRLASVPKDAATFPELDAAIRAEMHAELARLVEGVAFDGAGTLAELLTSTTSFASPALAAYYGGGADHRSGILTLGAVLATHARPNGSSPVHRGKWVRERLLCQPLAPPPPGLVVQPPPVDPALTGRERYARHASEEPCASCHRLIDPIGFAFEHFDGIGRFRETEGGRAIDDAGEIVDGGATSARFQGTRGLGEVLAASPDVSACFTEQWARFAFGVTPRAALECERRALAGAFTAAGGAIPALAAHLAATPHLRRRAGSPPAPAEPEPEPEPPPPPPPEALTVTVREDSRWDTGHCDQVAVTNDGTSTVDWTVTLAIEGAITQHWNAQPSGTTGDVVFSGVDWNDTLDPGATATFGYCASL